MPGKLAALHEFGTCGTSARIGVVATIAATIRLREAGHFAAIFEREGIMSLISNFKKLTAAMIMAMVLSLTVGAGVAFAGGDEPESAWDQGLEIYVGDQQITESHPSIEVGSGVIYFNKAENCLVIDSVQYSDYMTKQTYAIDDDGGYPRWALIHIMGASINVKLTGESELYADIPNSYFGNGDLAVISAEKNIDFDRANSTDKAKLTAAFEPGTSEHYGVKAAAIMCGGYFSATHCTVFADAQPLGNEAGCYGIYADGDAYFGLGACVVAHGGQAAAGTSAGICCDTFDLSDWRTDVEAFGDSAKYSRGVSCNDMNVEAGKLFLYADVAKENSIAAFSGNNINIVEAVVTAEAGLGYSETPKGNSCGLFANNNINIGVTDDQFCLNVSVVANRAVDCVSLRDAGDIPVTFRMLKEGEVTFYGYQPSLSDPADVRDAYRSAWSNAEYLDVFGHSITDCTLEEVGDATWNRGKDAFPNVVITTKSGHVLTPGEDYDFAYADDDDNTSMVGDARCSIYGTGKYIGSFDIDYKIVKAVPEVTLSKEFSYATGKTISKPKVTVSLNGETLPTSYYSVSMTTPKKPGSYTVKVTSKKSGMASTSTKFFVKVKPTTITTLTSYPKAFYVKVAKLSSTYASGYQVRYSKYEDMSKYTTKTIGTKYKYTSKKITKLAANTTYYVKVRTYKYVSGKKYYSDWSDQAYVVTQ